MDIPHLWQALGWPLTRLLGSLALGLFLANLIEALNWTRFLARFAAPIIRIGHLKDVIGASFSMAFFSGMAANSLLAEAYGQGRLTDRELILANLFNSLPTYFLHLPQMFLITVPFIGARTAATYVGLTLLAAIARSAAILVYGRLALPPLPEGCVVCHLTEDAFSWKRPWPRPGSGSCAGCAPWSFSRCPFSSSFIIWRSGAHLPPWNAGWPPTWASWPG